MAGPTPQPRKLSVYLVGKLQVQAPSPKQLAPTEGAANTNSRSADTI